MSQLTDVTVEKSSVNEESKVPTIAVIPDEKVYPEKVFYHGVHVLLNFNKNDGVNMKEEQADIDPYTDAEEMEDVRLGYERERHWRMVFEDNDGGVDNHKSIPHAKRWDVYMNKKKTLIRGGYSVEV